MAFLNLERNQFNRVPSCICSSKTLISLTLSHNPKIKVLPIEMGKLVHLQILQLSGLNLKDPPKHLLGECRDCIRYLNSKLRNAQGLYHMKLMLVGCANRGKTTLVENLLGKEFKNKPTAGLDISEWWYQPSVNRKAFHFTIWDFRGQEEYYIIHQCFLSHRTLYLLLFNLKHGDKGVEELRPWLNSLALRAPQSLVIIIGIHLDEVPDEDREEIDALLHRVGTLATSYNKHLQIVEVLPVGLKNCIENISLLKEAIYHHAANYKNRAGQLIMGQKIPESYHTLMDQLVTVQQEVKEGIHEPIMHAEKFKMMAHDLNLEDMNDEELKIATMFLTDMGSLLHYDDYSHNLHKLYFVDSCWLYEMMSKTITESSFVKVGILYLTDMPKLFGKESKVLWQYFEQFLTLLDKFEIVLPIDSRRVLIPSKLSDNRPHDIEFDSKKSECVKLAYSRLILFNSNIVPMGFWSRLLSRIMHSVPKVNYSLDKLTQSSEPIASPTDSPLHVAEMSSNFSPSCCVLQNRYESSVKDMSAISSGQSSVTAAEVITPPPKIPSQQSSPRFGVSSCLPKLPSIGILNSIDAKDIHFEYWQKGLYYRDPEIMFRIESVLESEQSRQDIKDGVLITASANNEGRRVYGQLIDLVVSLVSEWYPGLQKGKNGSYGLEQRPLCSECIKEGRQSPFEFDMKHCLSVIAENEVRIDCGYFLELAKNHKALLSNIIPDYLLTDIDSNFLLDARSIVYKKKNLLHCLQREDIVKCIGENTMADQLPSRNI